MKLRLAILDADILSQPLQAEYHSYGCMVIDLLQAVGAEWDIRIYPVIHGVYPDSIDDFDACLIPGSKYDSFGDDEWIVRLRDYIRTLYARKKPMVGICFGHQLLAHALDGHTDRSTAGWGLGVMRYTLVAHPGFVQDDGLLGMVPGGRLSGRGSTESKNAPADALGSNGINLIISHQDQVQRLPPDATLLLSSAFCPNAGFYIPGRVLALQGHPEFTVAYATALLSLREENVSLSVMHEAREALARGHEGLRAGRWIRRFLEGTGGIEVRGIKKRSPRPHSS